MQVSEIHPGERRTEMQDKLQASWDPPSAAGDADVPLHFATAPVTYAFGKEWPIVSDVGARDQMVRA